MSTEIKEVKSKKELKIYIRLPEKIHKTHKNWLYPIYSDEFSFYNPKKNDAFSHSDTILFLAYKNGIPVGRIMGIINRKYNQAKREKQARFCFLDCYNDKDIAFQLIKRIEDWARDKEMKTIIGPFGFSDKEPQGILTSGFEQPTVIVTNHSFEYLKEFIESFGYETKIDLVQYSVTIPEQLPEVYQKAAERIVMNGFKVKEFTSRKELKKYIRPVFELINESYTKIFGFAAFTDKEIFDFANRYIQLLNPELIKLVLNKDNELLAFVVSMPDLSSGINKAKGRIFPFGFIHILRSAKQSKQLNLMLGAIKEGYRGKGFDTLMALHLFRSARKLGMKLMDSHLIMKDNTPMRSEMEKLNGEIYKTYRVYQKEL
jgi:GNAT superfamily N-acetyltransferase